MLFLSFFVEPRTFQVPFSTYFFCPHSFHHCSSNQVLCHSFSLPLAESLLARRERQMQLQLLLQLLLSFQLHACMHGAFRAFSQQQCILRKMDSVTLIYIPLPLPSSLSLSLYLSLSIHYRNLHTWHIGIKPDLGMHSTRECSLQTWNVVTIDATESFDIFDLQFVNFIPFAFNCLCQYVSYIVSRI